MKALFKKKKTKKKTTLPKTNVASKADLIKFVHKGLGMILAGI